jgi:hypothetical protein
MQLMQYRVVCCCSCWSQHWQSSYLAAHSLQGTGSLLTAARLQPPLHHQTDLVPHLFYSVADGGACCARNAVVVGLAQTPDGRDAGLHTKRGTGERQSGHASVAMVVVVVQTAGCVAANLGRDQEAWTGSR